ELAERIGPALHDLAVDGIALDESGGRVHRAGAFALLVDDLAADVREAGVAQQRLQPAAVVMAERHRVEPGRVEREDLGDRVVRDEWHRIALEGVPDVEQIDAARLEHAVRPARAGGVGHRLSLSPSRPCSARAGRSCRTCPRSSWAPPRSESLPRAAGTWRASVAGTP